MRDSRFNWFGSVFSFFPRFTRACLRACMCAWVRLCKWAHQCVRAYAHMRPGMSDLCPSIIFFSHTTLFRPILSQSWAKTSELLGRISTSELDPQPWHFTNNRIIFPAPDTNLGWTLYPPSTLHFTCAAHLHHSLPKRARLWGVHWQRFRALT